MYICISYTLCAKNINLKQKQFHIFATDYPTMDIESFSNTAVVRPSRQWLKSL